MLQMQRALAAVKVQVTPNSPSACSYRKSISATAQKLDVASQNNPSCPQYITCSTFIPHCSWIPCVASRDLTVQAKQPHRTRSCWGMLTDGTGQADKIPQELMVSAGNRTSHPPPPSSQLLLWSTPHTFLFPVHTRLHLLDEPLSVCK